MRIGSLFSGLGLLDLGLEWASVGRTVWHVEADPFCRRILKKHWPNAAQHEDIRNVGAGELAPVDVVCGGFPCQDVSSAGKKRGIRGEKSWLWREYARVLGELRPRFAVIENSAALVHRGLDVVLRDLAVLGYDAEWSVVSACAVGAPHVRRRLFVLAHTDAYRKPASTVDAEVADVPPDAGRSRRDWRGPFRGSVRVADGCAGGMDRARVRALGNAVVPQVAEVVGRRLLEIAGQS